jgi:hypothetical protein
MTVRIEYMTCNRNGSVLTNWCTTEGSVQNDAQVYIPRAYAVAARFSHTMNGVLARVRIIDEQTNRIVDILQ